MASEEREDITLGMLQKEPGAASQPEGSKKNQYLAAVIASFGAVSAGTALAWTSPVFPILSEPNKVLGEPLGNNVKSWIGSLIAISAIFGALPSGFFADKFGRKPCILFLCLPFTISWLLILFAASPIWLLAARVFQGFAIGGLSGILPMFIGEIAETSIRGTLGSFFQMFLTLGILYVYCLGLTNYTIIAIGCLIFPILLFIFFLLIVPDSPIYLMKSNQPKKAAKALQFYRGGNYDTALELETIQKEIEASQRKKASFGDLFATRGNRRALTVALGLMILQQFSGINIVIFYSSSIFKAAGSTLDINISNIIVGVVQCIVTAIATVLVDKAGRRILLLLSDFVMGVCLALLAVYFFLKESSDVSSIAFLPLLSVVLYIVMFSLGFGPLPWMMVGELFNSDVKGVATGIAVGLNWSCAFIVTLSFSHLVDLLGNGLTFCFFAVICFLGTVFVFTLVPETKGKSIAQVQRELNGEK